MEYEKHMPPRQHFFKSLLRHKIVSKRLPPTFPNLTQSFLIARINYEIVKSTHFVMLYLTLNLTLPEYFTCYKRDVVKILIRKPLVLKIQNHVHVLSGSVERNMSSLVFRRKVVFVYPIF